MPSGTPRTARLGRTPFWDGRLSPAERGPKRLRSTGNLDGRLATSSAGGRGAWRSASSRNHRQPARSRSHLEVVSTPSEWPPSESALCRFRPRLHTSKGGCSTPLQARRGDEPFVVTFDLVKELTPLEDTRVSSEPDHRDNRRLARSSRRDGGSGRMPVPFGGKDADRAAHGPPLRRGTERVGATAG
jgi:hypothetical protein